MGVVLHVGRKTHRQYRIHDKISEELSGGTLHDITYTSPKGGPVGAYLVVPNGKGPFAAVLFGHWGNGTRAELLVPPGDLGRTITGIGRRPLCPNHRIAFSAFSYACFHYRLVLEVC